jgi:hypothetical protein
VPLAFTLRGLQCARIATDRTHTILGGEQWLFLAVLLLRALLLLLLLQVLCCCQPSTADTVMPTDALLAGLAVSCCCICILLPPCSAPQQLQTCISTHTCSHFAHVPHLLREACWKTTCMHALADTSSKHTLLYIRQHATTCLTK